jgi:hypothetical protein
MRKNFNAQRYNDRMDKIWESALEAKKEYKKVLEDKLNFLYWEKTRIESAIINVKKELELREEN